MKTRINGYQTGISFKIIFIGMKYLSSFRLFLLVLFQFYCSTSLIAQTLPAPCIANGNEMHIQSSTTWSTPQAPSGDVIINPYQTLRIQSTVDMKPSRGIIIQDRATLILDGATITTSCFQMWRGIEIYSGGNMLGSFNRASTISNAQYGIYVNSGASIENLSNVIFDRNYVHIFIPPNPSGNTIFLGLKGCVFDCTSNLISPYNNQSPSIGTKTFAGLLIHNLNTTINGQSQTHQFRNLCNGIVSYASNLTVRNCVFNNIQPDRSYPQEFSDPNGVGIYVTGTANAGNYLLDQAGYGPWSATTTFSNCRTGIFVNNQNAVINLNKMVDVTYGIVHEKSLGKRIQISSNNIHALLRGIVLQFNFDTRAVIRACNIYFDSHTLVSPEAIGIYTNHEHGAPNSASNIFILESNIYMNRGNTAISINNSKYLTIKGNQLYLNDPLQNMYGLNMTNSSRYSVQCNYTIPLPSARPIITRLNSSCFQFTSSPSGFILCNTASGLNNGFTFVGSSYNKFAGNVMHNNSTFGLYISATGAIGTQSNTGNVWGGSHLYDAYNAGNPGVSEFWVKQGYNTNNLPYWPVPVWPATGWFNFNNATNRDTCRNPFFMGICDDLSIPNNPELYKEDFLDVDYLIARDSFVVSEYEEASKQEAMKYLFNKLNEDTTRLDSLVDLMNFYNDHLNSPLGELSSAEDSSYKIFNMNESAKSSLNLHALLIDGYMHEMDSVTVLLQDSISATERETLLSLYTMLQQNINSLAAADSSVTAAFKSGLLDAADAVLAGNNGVYPTMEFESNEKAVNEIFLKTIANETYTFTNDQLAILLNIINQCPFTGGTAVYRARGLYNLVNDSMQYDDFETCLQNGILLRQGHSALPIKQYRSYLTPNPASDVIVVNYELPERQTGKIIFYDFLGIAKAEFILPEDQNQLSITAEYFTNGMYFYKIISNDQLVSEGKLAIIR